MNILVIGNGFDLWHGLPTKYTDFLDFAAILKTSLPPYVKTAYYNEINHSELCQSHTELKDLLSDLDSHSGYSSCIDEFLRNLKANVWFEFFLNRKINRHNWVGFEGEISKLFQALKSQDKYNVELQSILRRFYESTDSLNLNHNKPSQFVNRLLKDLDRLIRCLEIYLCLCLEIIPINKKLKCIAEMNSIHKVLSFNYTNTFERVYDRFLANRPEYCYIHGKASLENNIDSNNMVLGIDELLDHSARNSDLEYIGFKKYYQRIFKKTDYNYTQWLKERSDKNIYIIGHSLDSTDQDVLRDIILQDRFNNEKMKLSPDRISTKIFYYSRDNNAAQIKNLVKVLGYDNVNALARGEDLTRSIVFSHLE